MSRALEKKVARTLETLEKGQMDLLH